MNDQEKKEQYPGARDREIRAALDQHWAASDANDLETEHRIYHEDAVLEYPQSGERTRGRNNIQNQRAIQPSKKRFTIRRIIGSGDLWITEFILTYDDKIKSIIPIVLLLMGERCGEPFCGNSTMRTLSHRDWYHLRAVTGEIRPDCNLNTSIKVPTLRNRRTCKGCVGSWTCAPTPPRWLADEYARGKKHMSETRFIQFVKGRYWVTLTKTAEHPYKVFQDRHEAKVRQRLSGLGFAEFLFL